MNSQGKELYFVLKTKKKCFRKINEGQRIPLETPCFCDPAFRQK